MCTVAAYFRTPKLINFFHLVQNEKGTVSCNERGEITKESYGIKTKGIHKHLNTNIYNLIAVDVVNNFEVNFIVKQSMLLMSYKLLKYTYKTCLLHETCR